MKVFSDIWTGLAILTEAFNKDLFMTTAGRNYWEQNIYVLINKNFHLYLNRGWEVKIKGTFFNSSVCLSYSHKLFHILLGMNQGQSACIIQFGLEVHRPYISLVHICSRQWSPVMKGLKNMICSGKMRKKQ